MYHLSDIYITEGNKKLPPFGKAHMDSVKTDLYLFFYFVKFELLTMQKYFGSHLLFSDFFCLDLTQDMICVCSYILKFK